MSRELLRAFPNVWSPRDKAGALHLLAVTDAVLARAKVPYMVAYGTLLGCIRHGGFIPWDDDIDVSIDERHLFRLKECAPRFRERGIGMVSFWGGEKVFPLAGRPIAYGDRRIRPWRWPFIDIFRHRQRDGRIELFVPGEVYYSCPVAETYPYGRAPFEDIEVPVPAQPRAHLDREYGPRWATECVSTDWNHRAERRVPGEPTRVSREELEPYYRFIV